MRKLVITNAGATRQIKKNTMATDTTLRMLSMLLMIPVKPGEIKAKEIKNKLLEQNFEVDLRTVQRDLHKLSKMFPLVSYHHRRSTDRDRNANCWRLEMNIFTKKFREKFTEIIK